ncbi:MAG TPA: hypothetical protein VJP40_00845 [bacterium]|nr:hypothetical protein [bacterium]
MNKISTLLIGTLLLSSPAWADTSEPPLQVSVPQETAVQSDNNIIIRQINYKGSDPLAIGDPLGNGPMTAKHDAGPPATHVLAQDSSCQTDTCIRASKRWNSPTTWQQDRATGLSIGWGD